MIVVYSNEEPYRSSITIIEKIHSVVVVFAHEEVFAGVVEYE